MEEDLKGSYELTTIDLKGFGRSLWPSSGYSIRDHVDFSMQASPNGTFDLVGHSLGRLVALEIALTYPERVNRLILLAPPMVETRKELKFILQQKSVVESTMALDSFWAPFLCHIHEALGPLSFHFFRPFVDPSIPDLVVKDAILHRWESYNESLES